MFFNVRLSPIFPLYKKMYENCRLKKITTFRQKERERNRTRVLELNFFLDSNKQEVDDLEIIPQLTVDEDDL